MKTLRSFFLFFSIPLIATWAASDSSELGRYARLRANHTYFQVSQIEAPALRFEAWFEGGDGRIEGWRFLAHSPSDITVLRREDMKLSEESFIEFPHRLPKYTRDQAPIAEAIAAKVKELVPDLRRVIVGYFGHYGQATLREIVPISPEGDPQGRQALVASVRLLFTPDHVTASYKWPVASLRNGPLCGDCAGERREFLDYRLSQELNGTSLIERAIALSHQYPERSIPELMSLKARALQTIIDLRDGRYQDPFEKLLLP